MPHRSNILATLVSTRTKKSNEWIWIELHLSFWVRHGYRVQGACRCGGGGWSGQSAFDSVVSCSLECAKLFECRYTSTGAFASLEMHVFCIGVSFASKHMVCDYCVCSRPLAFRAPWFDTMAWFSFVPRCHFPCTWTQQYPYSCWKLHETGVEVCFVRTDEYFRKKLFLSH